MATVSQQKWKIAHSNRPQRLLIIACETPTTIRTLHSSCFQWTFKASLVAVYVTIATSAIAGVQLLAGMESSTACETVSECFDPFITLNKTMFPLSFMYWPTVAATMLCITAYIIKSARIEGGLKA